MNPKRIVPIFFLCLMLNAGWPAVGRALETDAPFPIPDVIASNVAFWSKVYDTYTSCQGIIHDSRNLDIIYDIIDLKAQNAPGAAKINRKRIKRTGEKYRRILTNLAKNPEDSHADSRRVAGLFNYSTDSAIYRQAAQHIRCQVGQRDRFMAGVIRSGAYLDQIRDIFRRFGLPEDLAYLPHVESSFNPKAYSKFGAAGIWQFTRSTGRRFMTVGYDLDERRDPIIATYGAAQLLKENYEKLGSWPLAITAYNHGAAGILRAQQVHGDYAAIVADYRSRTFKFASRNFYAEFLAARRVAAHYRSYFGELTLDRPIYINTQVLDGYVAFKDVCRYYDLDPMELRTLNPALRQPVIEGQKHIPIGYALRLPARLADPAHDELVAALPEALYHSSQKPSRFYTVQRNDTAGQIARMHGVHLQDLILANSLDHRATIYPRQTLRIPVPGEPAARKSPDVVVAMAETAPSASNLVPEPKSEPAVSTPPDDDRETYLQPVLASVFPLPGPKIEPKAVLPATDSPTQPPGLNAEVIAADVAFEKVYESKGHRVGVIQVEIEETLGHYAEWADVQTQQIRDLNHLHYGSILHLHQKIKIPLYRTTAEGFEQNRYEYHKRIQEDFFSAYRISEAHPYRVSDGDNYWTLCHSRFDIPLWLLKHYNPDTDLAELKAGKVINIPEIEKNDSDDDTVPPMDEEI